MTNLFKIKDSGLLPGLIVGLTCTINGFYINLGNLNLRINDIAFYILLILWIIYKRPVRNYYKKEINYAGIIIISMFIYMIAVRMYFYNSYPPIYQDFFIKYLINKLLWFPIYIAFYMLYGGNKFILGILFGIGISSVINSILVIIEYICIINGHTLDYSEIKSFGISVESKKLMVFNQGLIRPTGFMIDPNYTGGYAGIGALYWDYLWHETHKRKYAIFAIISIIPMILLFSRTGLFPFILCFILSFFLNNKKFKNSHIIAPYIVITFSTILILLFIYVFSADPDLIENITRRASMKDGSTMARFDYLNYYFSHATFTELLFGVGMAGSYLSSFFGNIEVLHPESSYISMLIEYGVLFILVYVFVLFITFINLIKQNYYYSIIFVYLNLIGISYNFLGDRLYYLLVICFILYTYAKQPRMSKYMNIYAQQ